MKQFINKKMVPAKNKDLRLDDLKQFKNNSASVKQLIIIAADLLAAENANERLVNELKNSVTFLQDMEFLFTKMIQINEK